MLVNAAAESILLPLMIDKQGIISKLGTFNLLLVTLFLVAVIWYLQYRWDRRHFYKLTSKIPKMVGTLPLIGIAYKMMGNTENIMTNMMHLCSKGTPVFGWLGVNPLVILDQPDDIEIVLNSQKTLAKSNLYRFVKPLGGNGIFNAPVSIWKRHRKVIMPTFNQKILNQFFNVFLDKSLIFTDLIKQSGKPQDFTDPLTNWALDTISETALGVKIYAQTDIENRLVHTIHRVLEIFFTRITHIVYHIDFIYNFTSMAKDEKEGVAFLQKFVHNIIQEKYKKMEEARIRKIESPEAEIENGKEMVAFLDLFMEMRFEHTKFTHEELIDETNTLLITGSDTSSTVLGFILLILGMYPHVQQKVYEELIDIIGTNRNVLLEDLPNLKYMDLVIKESMRVFPIGPFIFREVEDDLDITNYTIPKGTGVGISTILLHRSDVYWKDPFEFIPERFLPEEVSKRHPYSYLPFSGGPRNCIGSKYAMMSMKTLLSTFIKKFHVFTHYTKIEQVRCKQDMLLKPVEGFPLTITLRIDDK